MNKTSIDKSELPFTIALIDTFISLDTRPNYAILSLRLEMGELDEGTGHY